jgi:uncharacterized protein (DUF1778 family)
MMNSSWRKATRVLQRGRIVDGVAPAWFDTMEQMCHRGVLRRHAMARPMASAVKRPRISIDVVLETRRRLRLAAAKRDLTIREYILQALEERLREDLGKDGLLALNEQADPVLARLWDNARDAEYDRF